MSESNQLCNSLNTTDGNDANRGRVISSSSLKHKIQRLDAVASLSTLDQEQSDSSCVKALAFCHLSIFDFWLDP